MEDLAPGTQFAGHRIEGVVARGGMGVVYRATRMSLGRTVALKVIAPELVADDEFRARFDRETQIAASLEHPNVIPVHEAGEEAGLLFLSMRFVDGEDMRGLLAARRQARAAAGDGARPPGRGGRSTRRTRGLVHRDVKPANLLIAPWAITST